MTRKNRIDTTRGFRMVGADQRLPEENEWHTKTLTAKHSAP